MPLHRSARLFTLGLALAGTCAAQDPLNGNQNDKPTRAQVRQQQKAYRASNKAQKVPAKVSAPKPRKTILRDAV